ncbi:MAG: putative Ig domain-containing protein [Chitinophagales bacterium]|nr:putative Ig domain-containing protein [Chitinophagales bacterium]MDW8419429.1 putative Ig domain-containing protein [Chitinophagales bacterium]
MLFRIKLFFLYIIISCNIFAQSGLSWMYEGPPVFHGAQVVGNRPGTPFLFTVPATGERPITFSAVGLPDGLHIEPTTGIIRGTVQNAGEYPVTITAQNAKGKSEHVIRLIIGDKLCLTPPMGWNSWNVFAHNIDEKLIMEMADAMVNSGMRDVGYQYINLDDFWHDTARAPDGSPRAHPEKFPRGIKWLAEYVHAKGLKLGIYSDAGHSTCGKCFGSYGYENKDAAAYAGWGVDLLKYDFCFVPWRKKEAVKRYARMGEALRSQPRSIVYSICNWGLFAPWKWGPKVGGNYWRTTPDIVDSWNRNTIWYGSVMSIIRRQNKLMKYQRQGHWNDPDMLIVGNYGKGKSTSRSGKYNGLTDTEYQSHFALWAFMNAPLLSSCDLRNMNDVTKNILMNPLLLSINQDSLASPPVLRGKKRGVWVYEKKLSGGRLAYLLLNTRNRDTRFINVFMPPDASGTDAISRREFRGNQTELPPHGCKVFIIHP